MLVAPKALEIYGVVIIGNIKLLFDKLNYINSSFLN